MTLTTTFDMKQTVSDNRLLGLYRMMTGFRLYYIGAIASLTIATLARTLSLLLIGWLVDDLLSPVPQLPDFTALTHLNLPHVEVIHSAVPELLPWVALGFLVLAVFQGAFSYLSGRWASHTAESVAWRLKNYLFDHIQRLTFTYHDRMQTGELLQRVTSDVDAIRRFYVEQGVGIGRILIMFSINMAAIVYLNATLALLSVLVIPVLIVVSLYFFHRIGNKYEEFQEQDARLSTALQENLSGVRVVKAFARQQYEADKFEQVNWQKFLRGKELLVLNAVYWPITDLLTGAQMVLSFLFAGFMALDGQITVGDFIAYAGMVTAIINPMRQLGRLIVDAARGLGSYARVSDIIQQIQEPLDEQKPAPVEHIRGDIVFKDVNFAYVENELVLKNITFDVKAGQVVALLGATGSGKTSLVNLLPRFYEYTSGSITIDGVELRDFPKSFLRKNIGIVEQEPFLFSRTIRENITYGVTRDVTDEEVYEVARAAAVHDVIMQFPEGYQTLVGERGVTLSGGQKQRIVLARTLLKNPSILILDDATSSVDTETEAAIREALRRLMKNRTSFVIAHRVTTLMHADLILVMDHGRIVQMGTHQQLLAQDGIYRRTFEMQSRIDEELEKELSHVG
ncbi:MAG: ABC transporter ATP-binding protein [Phototrophicales bacterium]|nr:MAG: ABC transporter ATP-binding protein [Phototrophicales bacterium]RMG75283.1 MAG: ABC transporter ATP-binding protein [Chloroflexota bacterium]